MVLDELTGIFEMSNIRPKYHQAGVDLKFQIRQPNRWSVSGHGPRVKIFDGKNTSISTVIILDIAEHKIRLLKGSHILKLVIHRDLEKLIVYFKKYRYAYLSLWLDDSLDQDDLMELEDKDSELSEKIFKLDYGGML